MGKQKWDRIGTNVRGDWQLRAEYCHPKVCAYVVRVGYRGRSARYRVEIVGPLATVVLVFKSGKERWWTLGTAKRRAESVADYASWLVKHGIVEGEEDKCGKQS